MTTTYVNTPAPASGNNGSLIISIFAIIIFSFLFIYFGIPAIRNLGTPQINVPAPVINLPDKVDVNVQQAP
ncbi:MAG: hypothetical protein WC686_03125 [Candidatus Shapirobacteria bacterium]|jgi:hypothetical protein